MVCGIADSVYKQASSPEHLIFFRLHAMQARGKRFRSLPAFVLSSLHAGGWLLASSPFLFASFSAFCELTVSLLLLAKELSPMLPRPR